MWRNEANSFDRWPSMCDSHDLVQVQKMFHCPPSPMALDARGGVNEDSVEIKQHRIASEVCHERRVAIMTAERSLAGRRATSAPPRSAAAFSSTVPARTIMRAGISPQHRDDLPGWLATPPHPPRCSAPAP